MLSPNVAFPLRLNQHQLSPFTLLESSDYVRKQLWVFVSFIMLLPPPLSPTQAPSSTNDLVQHGFRSPPKE